MWVVNQVRNRKTRQAVSSLKQPMLQSAYSEPPVWTLPKLVRSAVITLVSGAIAGETRQDVRQPYNALPDFNACSMKHCPV